MDAAAMARESPPGDLERGSVLTDSGLGVIVDFHMMRKVTAWSVCGAFLLGIGSINPITLAAQTPAAQAPAKGIVTGTAIDGSSKPLAGAALRLQGSDANKSTVMDTTANGTGAFTFNGVTPGSYVLKVQQQGRTIGIASNVQVRANQTTQTTVTAIAQGGPSPGAGFNLKKFAIVSALVTAALTVAVAKN